MQLLVSVANAAEAAAALAGGADIIDAKDPLKGALGPVSLDSLRAIAATVVNARPVTAALGDYGDEGDVEQAARDYATAGASLVKIGFAGINDAFRVQTVLNAAVHAIRNTHGGVVAVAYLDRKHLDLSPAMMIDVAATAGAAGVLLDTADKRGPGLRQLMTPDALAAWIHAAHAAGLLAAVAGKLTAEDLPLVNDAGADIAGVRGAACDAGRTGRVVAERVRQLRRSGRLVA
jgi:uncharacterized protein (UPF0264 family)